MKQVIVVVLDSIPFRCIGCYGNQWINTQTLDQMAHQGVTFDFCFSEDPAAGSWMRQGLLGASTLASCPVDPSESILHQLHQRQIRSAWIGDSAALMAEANELGFDRIITTPLGDATWDSLRDRALDWLQEHSNDSWLLWLQLTFSAEWQTPSDFADLYLEEEESPVDLPLSDVHQIPPEQISALSGELAGRVVYFDHWLGELRDLAGQHLDSGNILWIVTADQGFPLGEHETVGLAETTLYEERVHLPLIVPDPQGKSSYRSPSLVQPVDLRPTLIDLFELSVEPPTGSSFSFMPTVRGTPAKQREYACLGAQDQLYAIRAHNWKLILPVEPVNEDDDLAVELYVKPEDTWDTDNVADLHPHIADRLELQLRRHLDAAKRGTLPWLKPLLPSQLISENL